MIYKSYLVEDNLELLKNNLVLFYGENLGLLAEIKEKLKQKYKNQIIKFNQEEILNNPNNIFNEIGNQSLFDDNKIIFIDIINDKIFTIIKDLLTIIKEEKVFIFANILEKKSKLRSFFEKEKKVDVIPCYQDNELTTKKIIMKTFKDFKGLTPRVINLIVENCSNDRSKLNNEIEKIKSFFINKDFEINNLEKLLNMKEDDDFNLIKDNALIGDKVKTNRLLNSTILEEEKLIYYLSSINQRMFKLKEIVEKGQNIENSLTGLKPPIFWKDKPAFIQQAKIWNLKKLNYALRETYNVEIKSKSNSHINKKVILKKLIVDICNIANAA